MTIGYYKLAPELIFKDIVRDVDHKTVRIKGLDFFVHPHVYPSDKFRTTNFLLDSIGPLVANAHVCDMGCGFGIVGLYALHYGAKSVVQADINPMAVKNAKANKKLHAFSTQAKIYKSDCFDDIPKQKFEVIVFNIPFHNEPCEIIDPLQYAFHDPMFKSVNKFLSQAVDYCHSSTKIIIAFSNKGDVNGLETIFDRSNFMWDLWKVTNTHQEFDNRLYQLRIKE
jgi:methylase of polypeptide subunit release factors